MVNCGDALLILVMIWMSGVLEMMSQMALILIQCVAFDDVAKLISFILC